MMGVTVNATVMYSVIAVMVIRCYILFIYGQEYREMGVVCLLQNPLTVYYDIMLGSQGGKSPARPASPARRVVRKRMEDHELAAVPWQTLWLLQSSKQECDYQQAVLRSETFSRELQIQTSRSIRLLGAPDMEVLGSWHAAEWLRNGPQESIGHCPVRFRPHVDPHRWLPRNLVISECLCEGSPCARHGLHVCVTVFAARTVYSLHTGKKRVLIAVGCVCAIQKTRLAKIISTTTLD
ncbi:hypothetical protein J6590_029356 [Homalodisca vitripennis]|nr:hypothetical protein J6590_029356 [Homalodisca vitripennis]